MSQTDDPHDDRRPGDGDFPLAPGDGGSDDADPADDASAEDAPWFPHREDLPPVEPTGDGARIQFTMAEMLALVTAAALFLGLLSYLPGRYAMENVAGWAGLAAIIGLGLLAWHRPQRPIFTVSWWLLLGLWATASIAALVLRR